MKGFLNKVQHSSVSLLVALLLLLLVVDFAHASAIEATGSSAGTMVAAAMETVGYHAQAEILEELNDALSWTGALIYVCVILSAVLTISMHGSYRPALWILVAPPIFFWASGVNMGGLSNREFGAGAEWRFGEFRDVDDRKSQMLQEPDIGEPAEVSYLFHRYNQFVSELSQHLIKVLIDQDIGTQMIFMARQRTFEELMSAEIMDSHLAALGTYFLVFCETEIADAHAVARGNRDPSYAQTSEYQGAANRYCKRFPKEDKTFQPGVWMDYVYANFPEDTASWTIPATNRRGREATQQKVSCKSLWKWYRLGAAKDAEGMLEVLEHHFDPYAFRFGLQIFQETVGEVWDKLIKSVKIPGYLKGPEDPCPSASTFDLIDSDVGNPQPGKGPTGRLQANAATFKALTRMISSLMMRKQLNSHPTQEIIQRVSFNTSNIAPRTEGAERHKVNAQTKKRILRRQRAEEFAQARRYEAFMLLHLLPYLQGLLLYILAATYPFFALLILLPSHANSFFTWMALWAWVKSWDVGWAAIMVADEIIWELLPHATSFNPQDPAPYSSAVTLLAGAYDGDSAYSLSTYWLLLSMMVTGVPMVTAQFILGTKKAVANAFVGGFQDIAQTLSGYAGDYAAGRQVGRYGQMESQAKASQLMGRAESYARAVLQQQKAEAGMNQSVGEQLVRAAAGGVNIIGGLAGEAAANVKTSVAAAANGDVGGAVEAVKAQAGSFLSQIENLGELGPSSIASSQKPPATEAQAQRQIAETGKQQTKQFHDSATKPTTETYSEFGRRILSSIYPNAYRRPGESVVPTQDKIDQESTEHLIKVFMEATGYDPTKQLEGIEDQMTREQIHQALRNSVYRRGMAYRFKDRGDLMLALGAMLGPVKLMAERSGIDADIDDDIDDDVDDGIDVGNNFLQSLDGDAAQNKYAAYILQNEELLDATIFAAHMFHTQDSLLRSMWWQDAYYGAGNLADRSEFFLEEIGQLTPESFHQIPMGDAYAEMEFVYRSNQAHADSVRFAGEWIFKPLLKIWEKPEPGKK